MARPRKGESDREILIARDRDFQSALDHPTWVSWRANALKCYKYRENDQWTTAERAELRERGQPDTVNNQVKVTLDRLVGQFTRFRTNLAFRGRNAPQDDNTADVLTDIVRYIQQTNDLEYEERDCVEDGFCGGFSGFETFVTFDDLLQPEIIVRAVDPFELFPDPHSRRYDWNQDATFICRARWLDLAEAEARWPDAAKDIRILGQDSTFAGRLAGIESFTNRNYIDVDDHGRVRRIRVVEEWYKRFDRDTLVLGRDASGQAVTLTLSEADTAKDHLTDRTEIVRAKTKLFSCTWTGGILLDWPREAQHGLLFPYTPYFVQRKKSGEPYSSVWTALSIQDAINKRESKALHLLTANQAIYEKGAVTDKTELAVEMAKPDGQIEINPGYSDRFKIDKNVELAVSQFEMHKEAKADFRRVTGVNPDALGERSEVRSGVGIARKQAMTEFITARLFDNFRRTRVLLGRVLLEFISAYYTAPKTFLVTDDLNASKSIVLDAHIFASIKQNTYDVVAADAPDATTRQEEQMQLVTQLLPQIIPFGPQWAQVLLEMSDVRNKQELIQRIGQMSAPPPPDPKISVALQWESLTPEEKVAWAGKLGMPALAQAQQMHPQPSREERESTREQFAAEHKSRELDIKAAALQRQAPSSPAPPFEEQPS